MSESFLLGVSIEHLLDRHLVACLALPLHRSVDLGTSDPSLVAVLDRHPDGETVGLPLVVLNWPLPAVVPRKNGPFAVAIGVGSPSCSLRSSGRAVSPSVVDAVRASW